MKNIYLVEGSTGEYSNRDTWMVKAFTSKAKAEELVKVLDDWLRANQVYYTGTRYNLIECKLEEE
jgi:hypothetical protein